MLKDEQEASRQKGRSNPSALSEGAERSWCIQANMVRLGYTERDVRSQGVARNRAEEVGRGQIHSFIHSFIYLFIYGCAGPSLRPTGFL